MKNPWHEIEKPDIDFNVRLVGESHPLRLYWGRDTQGRYLFIYESPPGMIPDRKSLPKLAGISVVVAFSASDTKLVLILNDTVNWELFHSLCEDLVRATSSIDKDEHGSVIFLRRLSRWQEFLKRERSGILSNEAIKGLIGELLFLTDKVAKSFSWSDAVSFWKGPEDAPQDFAVHDTAVEVKCQSGGSKPSVRVTSAEQLVPQLPRGFLAVYTIASADPGDPEAFTLNGLVAVIRSNLQAESENTRERFEDLLFMAGYTTREEYDEQFFMRIALKCYEIVDGFPRIEMASIPDGIERLSFTLRLESCSSFAATPDWWEENNES
ncbi:hypothetical protein DDZ13_02295 [Coraliomargarita sinensis]|uniref:PD-(D/E)XK motif protein n=1 Tax=Coraliomargarita sinensis TaxID=2174842 RepID=A0A317ZL17_9BACT|nr:PD-(D/E)XK motif protein [Coraliomargarita sinensis]PXA05722.1 hypothetical protein DDZ13_02295 [Coraliomargarita sinensis]